MTKITRFFFGLICLSLSINIYAQEKITIFGYSDYAPYMYGKKKDAQGIYSQLIKAVFKRAELDIELIILPWNRALRSAEKGLGGLAAILKNEQRLAIFDYSDAIYEETLSIYTLKNTSFKFDNIADLAAKTIGIKNGFSYGEAFEKARTEKLFKVSGVKNDSQNFSKMLMARDIDCLITEELVASIYLKKNKLQDQVKKLDKPLMVGGVYLVFAKSAKQQGLLKQFNQALADMKSDGSYSQIVENFINNKL